MSPYVSRKQAALDYASRGWHIFPISSDTKGRHRDGRSSHLLAQGHKDASADIDKITAWWQRWPDANIGLSLAASGLVAIDADLYKPDCGWNDFLATRDLAETFVQASPRDGRHWVFAAPADATFAGKLCSGVDLKHRGYILLAPSTFDGQSYRIVADRVPAPCPAWLPRKPTGDNGDAPIFSGHASGQDTLACSSEVEELLSWLDPDTTGYDAWIAVL